MIAGALLVAVIGLKTAGGVCAWMKWDVAADRCEMGWVVGCWLLAGCVVVNWWLDGRWGW